MLGLIHNAAATIENFENDYQQESGTSIYVRHMSMLLLQIKIGTAVRMQNLDLARRYQTKSVETQSDLMMWKVECRLACNQSG